MGRSSSAALILALTCTATSAHALSDPRDFEALFRSLNELMEFAAPDRSVNWGNPETGSFGTITTLRRADRAGQICWAYERTYNDRETIRAVDGVACEREPGLWEIVEESPARLAGPQPEPAQRQQPAPAAAAPQTAARPAPAAPAQEFDSYTVRQSQKLLDQLGYDPGPVDGAYGQKTRAAIEQFERDRGLPVTGKPSASLIALLREAADGRGPPAAPSPEPAASAAADGAPPSLLLAEPPAVAEPPAAAPAESRLDPVPPPPPPPPPPAAD